MLLSSKDGTDVNTTFPIVGTHALMVAAAFGHVDMVRVLIDRGADVNAQDLTGWTPLHAAAFKGNMQIVRLLLARGAVAKPSTWFLESPSVMAEQLGYTEIIPILKQAELQTVGKKPSPPPAPLTHLEQQFPNPPCPPNRCVNLSNRWYSHGYKCFGACSTGDRQHVP